MQYCHHDTPIGPLLVAGRDGRIERVAFTSGRRAVLPADGWTQDGAPFDAARRQLDEWFAGQRGTFDLPLAIGGTPFQHGVWQALLGIGYGATCSYAALAARIGRPRAVRAVGAANGANPLVIVVPCHRVIGADGTLTGFGGGLPAKQWLLAHERAHAGRLGGRRAPAAVQGVQMPANTAK